ncbi:hypothetical protein Tco_0441925 [Tanacetum coccineum]
MAVERQNNLAGLDTRTTNNDNGDDDNYLFTMLGSPSPSPWQGSHIQIVVATVMGIWYRFGIRIPEPYLYLFDNNHHLMSQEFVIHYSANCIGIGRSDSCRFSKFSNHMEQTNVGT